MHLRAECYRVTAEAILKAIVFEDDSGSAEPKRQRLDSTVVRDKNSSVARQPLVVPGWSTGYIAGKSDRMGGGGEVAGEATSPGGVGGWGRGRGRH